MRFITSLPSLVQLAVGIFLLISINKAFNVSMAQVSPDSQSVAQMNPDQNCDNSSENKCAVGGLFTQSKDHKRQIFPLKHTEVKAQISGNLSRVEVVQTFTNPFSDPLEAVYVFPLPDQAAVDDMEIKIGDRTIKSQIKRREEAQKMYEDAKAQGRTTGLLEQERDNIFTQSLANIKPGEEIKVKIRYTDSLKFLGGNYEFVFPMVVGPRYIPGQPIAPPVAPHRVNTDQVPDGARINPPILSPGTRSAHDINVTVEIETGLPISNVVSPSHQIVTNNQSDRVQIALAKSDTIPNKDLILRYQVAGKNTQATVLTQAGQQGGHFATYLIPAISYKTEEIVPKDVIFLMDTSGSQQGDPLLKSQELMRRFINGLNPDDTFTIIDFANTAEALSTTPLANTPANRQKAIDYVNQLQANGGTELLNGIQAVLNFPAAESGRLRSIVLLTDGYIGNENEILNEVQKKLKPGNRLYSFGVGSSVNRFILERLAEVGRGTVQVVRQDEATERVAEQFFQQINNPVLTNISISWEGGGTAPEIYPSVAPDLFANQPLVLFGKKADRTNGQLKITGTLANGERYEQTLAVNFNQSMSSRQPEASLGNNIGNEAIAQLWGRAKIKALMNQMFGGETKSGVDAVVNTALNYRLLSQYTAFVAISEEVRVAPDGSRQKVEVPVEMPEGVSYDGIFGNEADPAISKSSSYGNTRGLALRRVQGAPTGGAGRGSFAQQPIAPIAPKPMSVTPLQDRREMDEETNQVKFDRLAIVDIDGLDQKAIESLQEYLKAIDIPSGYSGGTVWEILLKDGRVDRVVLDDQLSKLQEEKIINLIRSALTRWSAPTAVTGKVRLELLVKP